MRAEFGAKCLPKTGWLFQNGAGGGDLRVSQQADFTQDGGGRTGKRCAGLIQDRTCYGIIGGGCLKYERGEGPELFVCVGDTGVKPGDPADPFLLCAAGEYAELLCQTSLRAALIERGQCGPEAAAADIVATAGIAQPVAEAIGAS